MPTYNRKEKAVKQANNIINQIKYYKDIEFIISDNNSSDGTFEYLKQNCNFFPQMHLSRRPENIGLVGNMCFLFNEAKGKYVWFISDDDTILDNSVEKIYRIIVKERLPFYLLNFRVEHDNKISESSYWDRRHNDIECFESNWGGFGFLSAQILKKDVFNKIYARRVEEYNLCQPVAISLYGIFKKGGRIIKEDTFLMHHVGDYSWAKYALQVGSIYNFDAVDDLEEYITPEEKKMFYDILFSNNYIRTTCIKYILKKKDLKFFMRLIKNGYGSRLLLQLAGIVRRKCMGNSKK